MIGYEKFNQAAIQVAAGQGGFYEDLGGIRNPNNPTPRPWDWGVPVVTDSPLNVEPV